MPTPGATMCYSTHSWAPLRALIQTNWLVRCMEPSAAHSALRVGAREKNVSTCRHKTPRSTRSPEEAIIVLIDISGSMGTTWDSGVSRLNAVKQLFHAFANRTMAYNLFHVVGFTLFANKLTYVSKVTELFEQFK